MWDIEEGIRTKSTRRNFAEDYREENIYCIRYYTILFNRLARNLLLPAKRRRSIKKAIIRLFGDLQSAYSYEAHKLS